MVSVLVLSSLWIPLVKTLKALTARKTVLNVGFFWENDILPRPAETIQNIPVSADRVSITFLMNSKVYIYCCKRKDFSPRRFHRVTPGTPWFKQVVLTNANGLRYDVTFIVAKYAGPDGDFFGNPFDLEWIPEIAAIKNATIEFRPCGRGEYLTPVEANRQYDLSLTVQSDSEGAP